eukprot:scaffold196161_cov19-Prasinocladus_malaysianus.AAC.1
MDESRAAELYLHKTPEPAGWQSRIIQPDPASHNSQRHNSPLLEPRDNTSPSLLYYTSKPVVIVTANRASSASDLPKVSLVDPY